MNTLKVVLAVEILIIFVNGFTDVDLIKGYFNEKMTNYASIIGCFKQEEKLKLMKSMIFGKQTLSILNINETQNVFQTVHNHIGVVLDGDCSTAAINNFLIKCGENSFFGVKYHWLILASDSNFSNIFENVELYINADINVVYPEYQENSTVYIVQDVYNPASSRGGSLKTSIIGYYTKKKGYVITTSGFKYDLRKNMTGVTLKSIVVLPIDFNGTLLDYLNSDEDPHINTFNRFHHSLLRPCVQYYNFQPNITLSKSWGYITSDGTFDGLVGALERKQVDYGSSPLFVRADRSEVMEYGRRTWTLRAAFIFKNPKTVASIGIFVKPLSTSIWLSLFFTSSCVLFILKFTQSLEKTKVNKGSDTSWSYLVICAIGVFSQQGISNLPYSYSGRITMMFMRVLSYLVYQFYSASIVSNLLIKPKTLIKSVEDILKSTMKAGCEDILYNRDYFLVQIKTSSNSLRLFTKCFKIGAKTVVTRDTILFAVFVSNYATYDTENMHSWLPVYFFGDTILYHGIKGPFIDMIYTTDKPSKDLYFQKILNGVNNSNFLTPQDGLDQVKDGGYAFHVELATAYPIIQNTFSERSMCELREVQMYRTQPMHSNLQKYSPFRDMFDTCLQRLAEYGILHKEITYWHPKKPECVQSKDALNFHLGIEYFYPVLTLLLIGIVLSLIILTFELYLNFKHRVKKFEKIVPLYPFTN